MIQRAQRERERKGLERKTERGKKRKKDNEWASGKVGVRAKKKAVWVRQTERPERSRGN